MWFIWIDLNAYENSILNTDVSFSRRFKWMIGFSPHFLNIFTVSPKRFACYLKTTFTVDAAMIEAWQGTYVFIHWVMKISNQWDLSVKLFYLWKKEVWVYCKSFTDYPWNSANSTRHRHNLLIKRGYLSSSGCHPRGSGDPVTNNASGFPPSREWRKKKLSFMGYQKSFF